MTWTRTRLACAALLVVLLQAPRSSALRSVREKQVKLEDIERDNLQSELLKQRPDSHPAYHQHPHQHPHQHQPQQEQEPEQAYHPQHYQQHQQHQQHQQQQQQHLQQPHYRFEQPAAPQLQQQHHHHHLQSPHAHLQQQQQHLLYQTAAPAAPAAPVVPTHVMYLLMPNGNVAAFQIAPHPNHLQAYYTPSGKSHLQQMSLGTLFHQHASIPMAYLQPQPHLQAQLQAQLQQQVQYVPASLPTSSQHAGQRYHPTVHHQPTLSFNSPQAHQLHAQHFRELSAEQPSPAAAAISSAGPEISSYSQSAEQQQQPQPVQQSHKSLFGAGVKATASPPLKGSFSTQTGQSYANFRQYG